ncbi:MAG: translation initiation factor IF-2 [Candidatus Dasytiphilus stammeri]
MKEKKESIKSLALEIKIPIDEVIKNFAKIGIYKSAEDYITPHEKKFFLKNITHNPKKSEILSLQRKTITTLNIPSSTGKKKLVQIEIRKKHTYLQKKIEINLSKKINFNQNEIKKKSLLNSNDIASDDKKHVFDSKSKKGKSKENIISREKPTYNDRNIINDLSDKLTKKNSNKKTTMNRHHRIIKSSFIRNKKNNQYYSSKNQQKKQMNSFGKKKKDVNLLQQSFNKPQSTIIRNVIIGETITVADLANKMAIKSSQIIKIMMKMGVMVTINQILDQETAQIIAEEMGHKVILQCENDLEQEILKDHNHEESLISVRDAIVTIMGHVDHGKTSLLDYILKTKITSGESGSITQRIGAYHVKTKKGNITFIDTPGHAAFTAMRARGVKVTDIVVLLIAIDDGVMPQTIEAIQHAKLANVPIIVAINKVDKLGGNINIDRVKNELYQYEIVCEEDGGDNQFVCISAKTGLGIDKLLNSILLEAEMLDLKANYKGIAKGVVIESFLDKGRGPIATVIIKEGIINKGDIVLCGLEYGRIRAIRDEHGNTIIKAGPSIPIEIIGLSGVPIAGDILTVVRDEKKAREVAFYRQRKNREVKIAHHKKYSIKDMFKIIKDDIAEINIIIKADLQGALEAIINSLVLLSTKKIKVNIIASGVGSITEKDAILATTSNSIIIGFNVRAELSARKIIISGKIEVHYYSVIYNLIDDIKNIINAKIAPEYKYNLIGSAEVRNIFKSPKFGIIAGCMVINGIIKRNKILRILRANILLYEGKVESLRHFKEDVNEVSNGLECGIGFKFYTNILVGDLIQVFDLIENKIKF